MIEVEALFAVILKGRGPYYLITYLLLIIAGPQPLVYPTTLTAAFSAATSSRSPNASLQCQEEAPSSCISCQLPLLHAIHIPNRLTDYHIPRNSDCHPSSPRTTKLGPRSLRLSTSLRFAKTTSTLAVAASAETADNDFTIVSAASREIRSPWPFFPDSMIDDRHSAGRESDGPQYISSRFCLYGKRNTTLLPPYWSEQAIRI